MRWRLSSALLLILLLPGLFTLTSAKSRHYREDGITGASEGEQIDLSSEESPRGTVQEFPNDLRNTQQHRSASPSVRNGDEQQPKQQDDDVSLQDTGDPCDSRECGRWRECIVSDEGDAECVCQRRCSPGGRGKKVLCGSDGRAYANHCELRRAACLSNDDIQVDRKRTCYKNKNVFPSRKLFKDPVFSGLPKKQLVGKRTAQLKVKKSKTTNRQVEPNLAWVEISSTTTTTTQKPLPSSRSSKDSLEISAEEEIDAEESGLMEDLECGQQDYDFMKENLLLFYSNNGEVKRLGGADSLMASMFAHYDSNGDNLLQAEELWRASEDDKMAQLSQACILADMLVFDDVDKDGTLSVAEFYGAFNRLDSVAVVSLEKQLEVSSVRAQVGDNVEMKCDVTGRPPPPIVWRRHGIDLNTLQEEDIKVFADGSLYLTNVQLVHTGNYSCHAQKNSDIVQTHVLLVHTTPEVHVIPRLQSRAPGELAEMECHVTGVPAPSVQWLKNDEPLKMSTPLSSNSDSKTISSFMTAAGVIGSANNGDFGGKYTVVGNGTALMVAKIGYADTGAYMCVATSPAGASARDISSLVVQDEPAPTPPAEERRFFAFHDWGISVYDPDNCRLYHQVASVDIIPGTQEALCAERGHPCSWGRAINVADRYVYVSQPTRGRVLVISRVQMVVVDVVVTDKYPVELYYVPHLDQLWVLCWRGPVDRGTKTIQIIRDASQKKKHHTVHPEPVEGHFDLVSALFIPVTSDLGFPWKYSYVVHSGQNGLAKMDLRAMKYVRSIDFGNVTCHPVAADFVALGGLIVVSCVDPDSGIPSGQLVLDYITDEVILFRPSLLGRPRVAPDSQYVVTLHSPSTSGTLSPDQRGQNSNGHNNNNNNNSHSNQTSSISNDVTIVVQAVTDTGLHFLFDVKTTLAIADLAFFPSRTSHSYDLYASSSSKEDILLVNLQDGKVEMITGIAHALDPRSAEWGNSRRPLASAGVFGTYLVTAANEAVFVINGKTRTVNCEIGNVVHPRLLVWVRSP